MFSLSCKDMGIAQCNYVAESETREDVVKMAGEHFVQEHPKEATETMKKMTKEELEQKMMDGVKIS